MEKRLFDLHIQSGTKCGIEHTCGKKVKYKSEATAVKSAEVMTKKMKDGKILEAYPCAFCNDWHIGRKMTEEEMLDLINRVN